MQARIRQILAEPFQEPYDAPPLSWGILGAGKIAGAFARSVTLRSSAQITAVGSRDLGRGKEFVAANCSDHGNDVRVYDSYEQLVYDPAVDAVYVASPHSLHMEHALLAINAGKHVLVEKAFARNVAEAKTIFAAAQSRGVFVMEAMWTRFLPHMLKARQIVREGLLGDRTLLMADHGYRFPDDPMNRLHDRELAGGALLDVGVYPVSLSHDFLGKPNTVQAAGSLTDTGVDGQLSAILDYGNRGIATVSASLWTDGPTKAWIGGSRARIEFDRSFYRPSEFTVISRDGVLAEFHSDPEWYLEFEAAEVARCIAAGKLESGIMTWQDTLDVLQTMDAIRDVVGVKYPGE